MRTKFGFFVLLIFYSISGYCQYKFIKINQKAPNIITSDIYDKPVNLLELTRTNKVLITFQRFAACPICNFRIQQLIKMQPDLQKEGVEIIMFIESNKENILKNLNGKKVPFHIISDPQNKFYNLYGVEKNFTKSLSNYIGNPKTKNAIKEGEKYVNPEAKIDGSRIRIEAEFLVNSFNKIIMAHYGEYIGDFVQMDKVKSFVVRE